MSNAMASGNRNRGGGRGRNPNVGSRSNHNSGNRRSGETREAAVKDLKKGSKEPEPDDKEISRTGVYNNARMVHSLSLVVGSRVVVTMKNASKYCGLLQTMSSEGHLALSFCNRVDPNNPKSLTEPTEVINNMIVNKEDYVTFEVCDVDFEFAKKAPPVATPVSGFVTDAAIAQRAANGQPADGKVLLPWDDSDSPKLPLEVSSLDASPSNGWEASEMFDVNARMFNVRTSYEATLPGYTTMLPTEGTEEFIKREREAAKLAREIESSDLSRKRCDLENGEGDEEALYSAVHRPDSTSGPASEAPTAGASMAATATASGPASGSKRTYVVPQKRSGGGGHRGGYGGRVQFDGGRQSSPHARPGPQMHSQPPAVRSPPREDVPPRVNGRQGGNDPGMRSRSLADMPSGDGPHVPAAASQAVPQQPHQQHQQPLAAPVQSQPQGRSPPQPQPQSQPMPQVQSQPPQSQPPQSQAPPAAVPAGATPLGAPDRVQDALPVSMPASVAPPAASAAAPVSARTNKITDLKEFHGNFNLKCPESEVKDAEAAAVAVPKEAASKEEDASKEAKPSEADKMSERVKKSVLNPNASDFVPKASLPVSTTPTPPRPMHTQSPSMMIATQQFMSNQPMFPQGTVFPGAMPGPPPQHNQGSQYRKRAVVSMQQPRQDFSAAAQHATGQPLLAQPAMPSHQYSPYTVVPLPMMPMNPTHGGRLMNPTSMSLTHQSMQTGMDHTSQHNINHQQMFMGPPQHGPMPAHLSTHVGQPMPAHVSHPMATGQQSQAVQQMTPVTGPPNPNSVQHGGAHQQPPPTSGTPQPTMNYAPLNLTGHLAHQNQHTTSPQPMPQFGMGTTHGQQQHMQQPGGAQFTFAPQGQPVSTQAMQQYSHSQPSGALAHQAHSIVVMPPPPHAHMPGPMQAHQFGSHHVPLPGHANATPVIPVQSGMQASGTSGLQHPMSYMSHAQVPSQHGHQVPGYHHAAQ